MCLPSSRMVYALHVLYQEILLQIGCVSACSHHADIQPHSQPHFLIQWGFYTMCLPPESVRDAAGEPIWDPGVFTIIIIFFPHWWLSYNKLFYLCPGSEVDSRDSDDINHVTRQELKGPGAFPQAERDPECTCWKEPQEITLEFASAPTIRYVASLINEWGVFRF